MQPIPQLQASGYCGHCCSSNRWLPVRSVSPLSVRHVGLRFRSRTRSSCLEASCRLALTQFEFTCASLLGNLTQSVCRPGEPVAEQSANPREAQPGHHSWLSSINAMLSSALPANSGRPAPSRTLHGESNPIPWWIYCIAPSDRACRPYRWSHQYRFATSAILREIRYVGSRQNSRRRRSSQRLPCNFALRTPIGRQLVRDHKCQIVPCRTPKNTRD